MYKGTHVNRFYQFDIMILGTSWLLHWPDTTETCKDCLMIPEDLNSTLFTRAGDKTMVQLDKPTPTSNNGDR